VLSMLARTEGFRNITYDHQDITRPLGSGGEGSVGGGKRESAQGASGARNGEEFRGHCGRGLGVKGSRVTE
jgi:hypothetical protein